MSYRLDDDWIISFLNGKRDAVQLIAELADGGIALSTITCGEVLEGMLTASSPVQHRLAFDAFLDLVDLVPPNLAVARRYAQVRADLRGRGMLIPDNDIWVGATALVNGLTLMSRDQHFGRIAGLSLYGRS